MKPKKSKAEVFSEAMATPPEPVFTLEAIKHAQENLIGQARYMNEYAHDFITRVLFAASEYLKEHSGPRTAYIVCGQQNVGRDMLGPVEYVKSTGQLTSDLVRAFTDDEDTCKEIVEYRKQYFHTYLWYVEKVMTNERNEALPLIRSPKRRVVTSVTRSAFDQHKAYVCPDGSRSPYRLDAAIYTINEAARVYKAGSINEPTSQWSIEEA